MTKSKILTPKHLIYFLLFAIYFLLAVNSLFAKEITVIYTGETHAMLYPCNCPKEADGGIARRAALVKELRRKYPYALLLDSGGFFAGGLLDEYTQNTQLDMLRTGVNLKAMELMRYDAVTIGDDEFNFGEGFLRGNIEKTKLTFLSCNLKTEKVSSYIIKKVNGIKIGVIGVTAPAASTKAGGLKIIEPTAAVKEAVKELKGKGANIIVLLSHEGESEDLELIKNIEGIDILIVGHSRAKEEPFAKQGSTLILRPTWQGRRIDKITFTVKENKIINYKVDEMRLSDKVRDDPSTLAILPCCFSDSNCKKNGIGGACKDPGTLSSRCEFPKVNKVNVLIIKPQAGCVTCDTNSVINFLKKRFPGLVISYLYYPSKKADKLINDFAAPGLPVYLLGKEADKENDFEGFKDSLELKGDFYMVKPQISGVSYFFNRKKIKGRVDLFMSLYDKYSKELLDAVADIKPKIHFLVTEQQGKFEAARGNLEVEECLRSVCVGKYYPEYYWNYLRCRAKNINSSWWEDCLGEFDATKVRICAKGSEGVALLKENINMNKELAVMFGPTYLLDNQEIFGTEGVPTKKSLMKIIKR